MLLFDTSAIIGLVERRNPSTVRLIEEQDEVPLCHLVSLGELESEVRAARRAVLDPVAIGLRARSLAYARRLIPCEMPDGRDTECFGLVSTMSSRKVSHNDQWIIASAFTRQNTLVIEDREMHTAANSPELLDIVRTELGIAPQRPILI